MADEPTLTQWAEEFAETIKGDTRVCWVGTVQAVSSDGKSVDVVPQLRRPLLTEDDTYTSEELPTLSQIPLATVNLGGAILSFPVQPGGKVLVIFTDFDISSFLDTGAVGEVEDVGCHTASGAIALPLCAQPGGGSVSTTDLQIGFSGCLIEANNTRVAIAGETDAATLSSKLDTMSVNLALAFSTFLPGSGGASFPNPYTHPGAGFAASSKLKLGG